MQNAPDMNEKHTDDGHGNEQFPVDIKVKTIRFETSLPDCDLIRIVIMSGQATSQCSPYREYHYGNAELSVEDVSSFIMRSGTIESAQTQQAIDEFVGSMSMPLDIPQVVSFARGIYSPSGTRKRLYKATDPDDSTKMIGVLIEQDSEGRLVQVTWYKTRDTNAIFQSIPESLSFDLVRDESGAPSLDPNDIGGWAWHYSTGIGIGLSS